MDSKKRIPKSKSDNAERKNSMQRRELSNGIGFSRYGLIDEGDVVYDPPGSYPEDARKYLVGLSRCGTMSGGAKLAGVSVNRVYELRLKLEGFEEEEDIAKQCLTDALEDSLFRCGLGEVKGTARVNALEAALKAKKPEEYNRAQKHEVEGEVEHSWIDIVKKVESEDADESLDI